MIPTSPPEGMPYNRPDYDPLWQIASRRATCRCRCTPAPARCPQQERGPGGAVINYAKVGLLSAETLCYFAASGVLERFPDLHLVFVETGAGWFAYCCERMDEAFEEHEQWVKPKLARPPSAYVKEQCHVTLGADRAPLLTREITGIEPLLWASDYPHPEGHVPRVAAGRRADLRRRPRRRDARDRGAATRPRSTGSGCAHDQHAQGPRPRSSGSARRRTTSGADRCRRRRWSSRARRSSPRSTTRASTVDDLDGFALYSMGFDTSLFAQWLGVPEVRFTAMLTGGGGGAAGSVGLAAAAIATRDGRRASCR